MAVICPGSDENITDPKFRWTVTLAAAAWGGRDDVDLARETNLKFP